MELRLILNGDTNFGGNETRRTHFMKMFIPRARLNLLFLGDTNRVVAETPMNDVSTRRLDEFMQALHL